MSNIGFAGNIKSADGSARKAGFGTNRWQRQLFLADLQLFPAVKLSRCDYFGKIGNLMKHRRNFRKQ